MSEAAEGMEIVEQEIGSILRLQRRSVRQALSTIEERTNYTTLPERERAHVRNTIMAGYANLYNAFILLLRKLGYLVNPLEKRWSGHEASAE